MPLHMDKDYLAIIEADDMTKITKFRGYDYYSLKQAARRLRVFNELYGEYCNYQKAKDGFLYTEEREILEKYLPSLSPETIYSIRICEVNSDRDFLKNP